MNRDEHARDRRPIEPERRPGRPADPDVRAYRLRDIREQCHLTQVRVAEHLDVSQKRVSRIESGDIERIQVDTLRRYVAAIGGKLRVEVEIGEETFRIA